MRTLLLSLAACAALAGCATQADPYQGAAEGTAHPAHGAIHPGYGTPSPGTFHGPGGPAYSSRGYHGTHPPHPRAR